MVGCASFLLLVADSLGRRKSLLWTSIAQGLCMFYIGTYIRIAPPKAREPVPPAGYAAIVMIYLFAIFFQFGWGPVCWIYVSEIPTARLRAMNVALGAATQWLFNFVVARATPNMIATVGKGGYGLVMPFSIGVSHANDTNSAYYIYGSFCFSMFVFTWFFIAETKGLSLEKMDELFGAVSRDSKEVDMEQNDRAESNVAEAKRETSVSLVEKN